MLPRPTRAVRQPIAVDDDRRPGRADAVGGVCPQADDRHAVAFAPATLGLIGHDEDDEAIRLKGIDADWAREFDPELVVTHSLA